MRREAGSHEKFFLLPKTATQSPRNVVLADIDRSHRHRLRVDRSLCEVRKHLRHRHFFQYRQPNAWHFRALPASLCRYIGALLMSACRLCQRGHVNTSLSRTLFFWMCWCIRDAVHFDSRVHAAIKPSHYIRRATWPRKLRRQRRRRAQ